MERRILYVDGKNSDDFFQFVTLSNNGFVYIRTDNKHKAIKTLDSGRCNGLIATGCGIYSIGLMRDFHKGFGKVFDDRSEERNVDVLFKARDLKIPSLALLPNNFDRVLEEMVRELASKVYSIEEIGIKKPEYGRMFHELFRAGQDKYILSHQ
jgi:hypothetical protein